MMSCVVASVEHVLQDLQLQTVAQHCHTRVDFVAGCHRVHDVRVEFLTMLPGYDRVRPDRLRPDRLRPETELGPDRVRPRPS